MKSVVYALTLRAAKVHPEVEAPHVSVVASDKKKPTKGPNAFKRAASKTVSAGRFLSLLGDAREKVSRQLCFNQTISHALLLQQTSHAARVPPHCSAQHGPSSSKKNHQGRQRPQSLPVSRPPVT